MIAGHDIYAVGEVEYISVPLKEENMPADNLDQKYKGHPIHFFFFLEFLAFLLIVIKKGNGIQRTELIANQSC
jgi:hypothetical protein